MYFRYFVTISIWTNLNPLYPRMFCVKFGGKLDQWFWRRRFLKFCQFPNYLPLQKGVALHLNKLEFPSPIDALCQVWLKLAQLFWREDKNMESLWQWRQRPTTDKFRSEKFHPALGSGELKSKQKFDFLQTIIYSSVYRIKEKVNVQLTFVYRCMLQLFHRCRYRRNHIHPPRSDPWHTTFLCISIHLHKR